MSAELKTCFVISPIGEKGSATRDRADLVFEFVIQRALNEEFEIQRADMLSEPGLITNQIIDRVINADLVIADLSERNPNVFYELAIRHATKKPFVHIIAHDEDIPFDNAGVRAIKVDVKDLRSVDQAINELRAQVASAMSGKIESPISISVNLQEMKASGDEEKVALSAILQQISSLHSSISEIRQNMNYANYSNRNAVNALLGRYGSPENGYPNDNALAAARSAAAAASASDAANISKVAKRAIDELERFNSETAQRSGLMGRAKGKAKF